MTLYFRTRENGAAIFRLDLENRQRRLDMQQIAVVNTRNGEIKAHGEHELTAAERTEIEKWVVQRRKHLGAREMDDMDRLIDQIKGAAQWIQSRATDKQVEEISEPLLMAMHDLRATIVRRKSDALAKR
ncbi:MAG: hypothetical protein AAGE18_16585 [Pseudomonadota bacterium]